MTDQITDQPYATSFEYLSELKSYVGKELGLSDWITISQDRIDTFAKVTEDLQWIHIDQERARLESPYETTIAHGFLVLSLGSRFASETFRMEKVPVRINYGLDKVRFPNATRVGAQIRGRVSLLSYKEIPKGAKFTMKTIFEIKGEVKPACVSENIVLAYSE